MQPLGGGGSHLRLDYSYTVLPGNKAVTVNIWALFLIQLPACPYRNERYENMALSFHALFELSQF